MSYASLYQRKKITSPSASPIRQHHTIDNDKQQQQEKEKEKEGDRNNTQELQLPYSLSSASAAANTTNEREKTFSHTNISNSTPKSTTRARRRVSTSHAPITSASLTETSNNEITDKLLNIMQAREKIEHLVRRQKKDEESLIAILRRLLSREGNNTVNTQTALQNAIRDRNKALQLLNIVRLEGNVVVHRMHQNMIQQQQQIESLMQENTRLRNSLREALALNTVNNNNNNTNNSNNNNNDSNNDNNKNENLTTSSHGNRSNGGDTSEIVSSITLLQTIAALQAELRCEKQQRLQAEELSHKMALQHQRHVRLMEERLHLVQNSTSSPIRKYTSLQELQLQQDNEDNDNNNGSSRPNEEEFHCVSDELSNLLASLEESPMTT